MDHLRRTVFVVALAMLSVLVAAADGSSNDEAPTPSPTAASVAEGNPIAVPDKFVLGATNPGNAKCKFVDLHTIEPPPNPGFVGETLDDESVDGQTMWEVSFYLMLYANCERQARGLEPLRMYTDEQMVELQKTVLGISSSHGGFGDRGDIVGGATAEQHGGTLLVGIVSHSTTADDDDNDLWSPHEVARRTASGRQHNNNAGLVDHGGAMVGTKYQCIFGAVSLGATANGRMDVILFYGTKCAETVPVGTFADDDTSMFQDAIEWLAAEGITSGCNPPHNTDFCPYDDVTRGELAVFLTRAKGYPPSSGDGFVDDDGRFYEDAAEQLKAARVTLGCNPPTNDQFCGDSKVTRGEFAALMGRVLGLTSDGGGDLFVDDDGSIFESAIDKLGAAKITSGCNPPTNDRFCPNDYVTRGELAAFFQRAFSK